MCSWRHLALLLLLPGLSQWPRSSAAASDTLAVGESLTGDRTLVSAEGNFELGFFSPAGGNSSRYYVGIWYKQIPGRTVIWVMNRDSPVADPSSAELTMAPDGNLLLLLTGNRPNETIWSSNSTGSRDDNGTTAAVLLDTGNLVLRGRRGGNSSAILWQSFDHPTDTIVPGGSVGMNKSTGAYRSLRAWRSATDPSSGLYAVGVDPHGLDHYAFTWNDTAIYYYIGSWNGRNFVQIPEMAGKSDRYTWIFVNNSEEVSYSFRINYPSTFSRTVMSPHGQLTMLDWSDDSRQWLLHWATPTSLCDVYSVCGPFGLCDVARSEYCGCLPGFEPASPGDWAAQLWTAGCARKTSLQCGGNASSTDGFLPVQNVQLPNGNSSVADAESSGDCASACLRNCSCTAYAYTGGCLVWGDDLRNTQQLTGGVAGASTLFLRVAAADLAAANRGASTNGRIAILCALCVAVLAICLLSVLAWARRREGTVHHDGSLLVFSHRYLARCTKNYSHKVGTGSFGSVYRGTLPDHTAIAVKRLEGSAQGEKQFRTEVRTLGMIQHVNLVRLRGFCATGHERLLVYDYMPNGSLGSLLSGSGHGGFGLLDWRTRFGIMIGVARGLAYLHEQCKERIVHCDVKPENILLDAGFCPKVADFGMAKLIVRDFSQALTTTRGTVGYLAPEWILGQPITAKADVYSYGMMLLELISGRRNREAGARAGGCYFPLWAATKVRDGEFLAVLDEQLEGDADVEELGRACNVACWCIQQSEELRPTMGQVVQVLEGSLQANTAPVPRHLEQFCVEDSFTF